MQRIVLKGELPSPLNPPSGCVFSSRCPYAVERCRAERPLPRPVDERIVACHFAEQFLESGFPAVASGTIMHHSPAEPEPNFLEGVLV